MKLGWGDAQLHDLAKVDGAQGQNVGDGEALTGDIGDVREAGVQLVKPGLGVSFALLAPLGEGGLPVLVKTRDVTKRHAGGQPEIELDETAPHLYGGPLQRRVAKQVRGGMKLFEITADGQGFTEMGAIIELKHRDAPRRIFGQKLGAQILAGPQIHLLVGHLDAFLRQKHPDPAGVGGTSQLIHLHLILHGQGVRMPSSRDLSGMDAIMTAQYRSVETVI